MQSRSEVESGDFTLITREEKRALEYLGNVGGVGLTGKFDEDFEPIGPTLREQLTQKGLDDWIGHTTVGLDLLQTLAKSDPGRQLEESMVTETAYTQVNLPITITSNSVSTRTIYIGERRLCILDNISSLGWFINSNAGHFDTFQVDLDMAILFCLEQALFVRRRPNVDYHLADILI